MKNGRKQILSEYDKEFIRRCYKRGIKTKKILSHLQIKNDKVRDYHIHALSSAEKLLNNHNKKVYDFKDGIFNIDIYRKNLVTI